jgi:hypothetical protein
MQKSSTCRLKAIFRATLNLILPIVAMSNQKSKIKTEIMESPPAIAEKQIPLYARNDNVTSFCASTSEFLEL